MTDYTWVKRLIDQYTQKYRSGSLPKLQVGDLLDLSPEQGNTKKQAKKNWENEWPNGDKAGVYIFFDNNLDVIYVGKASMNNTLSTRLYSYFRYNKKTGACKIKHNDWTTNPRYVLTVAVPTNMSFEAPAIEEYLICKMQPKDNTIGIK